MGKKSPNLLLSSLFQTYNAKIILGMSLDQDIRHQILHPFDFHNYILLIFQDHLLQAQEQSWPTCKKTKEEDLQR